MYHCHISFYMVGCQRDVFETLREMPPLGDFTHSFVESVQPDAALLSCADVIFADVRGMDAQAALPQLAGGMKPGAELVVLSGREQVPALADAASAVRDIWVMPMEPEELRFRFLRWQQGYKLGKDCWQAEQLLDATMLCTPKAIWYKT